MVADDAASRLRWRAPMAGLSAVGILLSGLLAMASLQALRLAAWGRTWLVQAGVLLGAHAAGAAVVQILARRDSIAATSVHLAAASGISPEEAGEWTSELRVATVAFVVGVAALKFAYASALVGYFRRARVRALYARVLR
jgi:hypothetical protein